MFTIENQGTQPVGVYVEEFETIDGVDDLEFFALSGGESPLVGEGEAVRLDVGESFPVGIELEVGQPDLEKGLIDGDDEITIAATVDQSAAPKPGQTEISSANDLERLADPADDEYPLDGNYALTNDIDLSGSNIEPIGDQEEYFTGTLDGRGNEIVGVDGEIDEQAGLFYAIGGKVKDLSITATFDNESTYNVGALAASNLGTITNVTASGTVEGDEWIGGLVGSNYGVIEDSSASCDVTGASYLGGLAGYSNGTIRDSSASGTVTNNDREGEMFGGLVGQNWGGDVIRCSAEGDVTSTDDVFENAEGGNQPFHAGGLVGYVNHDDDGGATIEKSFATGDVQVPGQQVGGLVGEVSGTASNVVITNSYALGDIGGNDRVGGLVGQPDAGDLLNSYSTGTVEHIKVDVSNPNIGGLIGFGQDIGSIEDSYWDTEASGVQNGFGDGDHGDGEPTGLTIDEMTGDDAADNMGGFDFEDTWTGVEGAYPDLLDNSRLDD